VAITEELLDQLIKDYKKPEDLIGENGLLKQLTKRLLERAMQAEMTDHLGYPPSIRRVICTTNTIESLNMSLRKVTKNWGSFPNDEAMFKLLYLALTNISKKWTMPIKD
jgi:transposase-like protein